MSDKNERVVGVHLYRPSGTYKALIYFKKKSIHLGYFSTKEKAIKARERAQRALDLLPKGSSIADLKRVIKALDCENKKVQGLSLPIGLVV